MTRNNPSRRSAVLLLTLLVHMAMLWLLTRPDANGRKPSQPRLLVQLIAEPKPQATAPALPSKNLSRRVARPTTMPADTPAAATVTAALPDLPALAADPAASAAVPEPAASRPWLDPEKTRQAVRMMASQPSLRELTAQASEAPRKLSAGERFGQEVQQAAVGDCLKGEFLGGGMGILSAPFWVLAEARGKCRR